MHRISSITTQLCKKCSKRGQLYNLLVNAIDVRVTQFPMEIPKVWFISIIYKKRQRKLTERHERFHEIELAAMEKY